MRETISVKEVVPRLLETGMIDKSLKKPELAVKKLLRKGVIKGIPPAYQSAPWKIYKDSLEDYIELEKMRETISIKESVPRLLETGMIDKSLKKPEEVVRNLLQKGVIKGIPPAFQNAPWQVYKDSLEDYIDYIELKKMRETLSIKKAVSRLLETETIDISLKNPDRTVRKLLRKGVIKGIPPTEETALWQVYKDSLEDYIELKKMRETLSIKEAVSRLSEMKMINKSLKKPEEAVRNLLQKGVIKGIPPAYQNAHWQVYKDSLEDYIELKKMNAVALIPPAQWWLIKKEITSNDVDEILLHINHIREKDGYEKISSEGLHKLSNYINENLVYPLDALFVTDQMATRLGRLCSNTTKSHNGQFVRLVGLCLALKFQIKIDYSIAIGILNNTFHNKRSLSKSNLEEMNSCYEIMYWVTKVLYSYITDGHSFLNEMDRKVFVEKRKFAGGTSKEGSNIFLYLIAILLDNGKNAWNEVPVITIGQLRKYYLKTPIVDKREKAQMDYLYRNKTNLSSIFYCVNPKGAQIDMEGESSENHNFFSPEKFNEISEMAENYRIYLRMKKLSTVKFTRFHSVLNKKPKFITNIKHLTVGNIEKCCQEYVNHCKENRVGKNSCRSAISSFLSVLADIKQIFGQEKSLIGVTYDFPFEEKVLIDNKTGVPDQHTVYGRIKAEFTKDFEGAAPPFVYAEAAAIANNDVATAYDDYVDVELSKGLSETSGTFKTDIVLADKIVRAIYNFKSKEPIGSHEYYHEYQYTTMLRIIADAGTRSDEVINMPYNTLSYLDEHDVYIVILGLSKLGDRFGVVPVGKETAKMIEECTKMRKELFPHSEILMKMTGDKGYIEGEYIKQFINVDKRTGAIKDVSRKTLIRHLDKICKESRITRPSKTTFHFLRHRAAEYFFFGMSEYEFEHSDDAEYKMEVIKRLLRHHDIKMTNKYAWSALLDLLADKNLIFLRDMKSVKDYNPENKGDAWEKQILIESLDKRIQKDLETKLSTPGIHRIQLLLTSPLSMLPEEAFEAMNSTQDVSKIIDFIRQVDGEKSEGTIAVSGAAFGRCVNPTCWRHKEKITCISCFDHLIQKRDEPRLLREIVNCHLRTQEIYQNYNDTMHKEQLRSLQSRISICIEKMNTWLGFSELEIAQKVQKHLQETVTEAEISFKAFLKELEMLKDSF
ncbi:site-specific integrase [Neobacillus sp. MER 74]|uniref:site-specific integrase n=1 Tax=Neobacillus sp. MER 74 TaxID=2939566 RepID=UPI0020418836|nr:site-specific integrase [Neobacillus sp. MER 74]MCM3116328.1 site-specific integrase [Neobacillus sp. MER 74]